MPTPVSEMERIGARLRRIRLAYSGPMQVRGMKGWCERFGFPLTTYHNWENGLRRITIDDALKLVAKTGVSLDYIYLGQEGTLPMHVANRLASVVENDDQHNGKRA